MTSSPTILNLGLPDKFVEHGAHDVLLRDCGLDEQGIITSVNQVYSINLTRALPLGVNTK